MPRFSPEDLAVWSGGRWSGTPERPVTSVGHDTRTLASGALYVALPGSRVDGHDLIPGAVEAGAAAVLCRRGRAVPGVPCLEVEDPGRALCELAKGHRSRLNGRIAGITGSAGKTTAKDLLAGMLRQGGSTCATPGNWNNFVGLPLSLLRMEPGDAFGVFELGMNHAGEIAALADILRPDCGLITSIGEAHLEQLGSVDAIATEKSSLFAALPAEGFAVVDLDSDWRERMRGMCRCRQVTCSFREGADYLAHPVVENLGRMRVEDVRRGEDWELPLPLPGAHMMKNVLQTAVLARELGLTPEAIAAGLAAYRGSPMRWHEREVAGLRVINDAYNANPLSMRCAVRAFAELSHGGRKWAVLGHMAELGGRARDLHRELGEFLDGQPLDGVVLVGGMAGEIGETIRSFPVLRAADREQALALVAGRIPAGAAVLFKASRAAELEKVIDGLQERNSGL